MKQLPDILVDPAPPWQRDRLARWLLEWSIDRRLMEEPEALTAMGDAGGSRGRRGGPGPERFPSRHRTARRQASSKPMVGQIRLLNPVTAATTTRLWYVVILDSETANGFRTAPFGRFAEPALPGEWLTGRLEPNLRVLCLWNTRLVSGATLEESRFIDRLSESGVADAQAVWRSHRGGATLPLHLEQQVGPPLVHPLDPRWSYREEERTAMTELMRAAEPDSPFGKVGEPMEPLADASAEVALAAEPRAVYGTARQFRVGTTSLVLRAAAGPTSSWLAVAVLDADGQPSNALDSCVLTAPDGTASSPISNGRVLVPLAFLNALVVVSMPDGRRLPLHTET